MGGIGIVVNPKGRRYKENPEKITQLSFIVGDRASYQATEDIHDLRRVAEQFKTRDIEILAIGGGDGTTHVTLTHFIDVYGEKPLPKLTFLRGGTMNSLANSCNIKGAPEKILSNLIYKYHEAEEFETTEVDVMQINEYYGFLFGCGVLYRFMESYYHGAKPSPTKAIYTLSRSIGSAIFNTQFSREMFERFDGEVSINGQKWPFENWSAIYAGSIPILGLQFRVFHHAEEIHHFHAAGFSLPPRNILKHVHSLFLGKKPNSEDMLNDPAKEMKISLEKPMGYTIDGDMLSPRKEFLIKTGPRLKILVK
ncbi:MAG: hypothetical protein H7A32_03030 [Deltaproteobacteria bacterium]|nr:hypothetical protein [Deltaproteobacteria bacterium]